MFAHHQKRELFAYERTSPITGRGRQQPFCILTRTSRSSLGSHSATADCWLRVQPALSCLSCGARLRWFWADGDRRLSREEVIVASTGPWDIRRKLAQRYSFRTRRVAKRTRSPL